jgi:hypothetical protein
VDGEATAAVTLRGNGVRGLHPHLMDALSRCSAPKNVRRRLSEDLVSCASEKVRCRLGLIFDPDKVRRRLVLPWEFSLLRSGEGSVDGSWV